MNEHEALEGKIRKLEEIVSVAIKIINSHLIYPSTDEEKKNLRTFKELIREGK